MARVLMHFQSSRSCDLNSSGTGYIEFFRTVEAEENSQHEQTIVKVGANLLK